MRSDVPIAQCRLNFELDFLAEIVYTESAMEEKRRMSVQWKQHPDQVLKWTMPEAKSRIP